MEDAPFVVLQRASMLQTIREITQGWIAGIIISLIILTFALWGIHSYFVSNPNAVAVAVVNGTDISKEQVTVAYERMRRQLLAKFGYGAVKNEGTLRKQALKTLIETEVLKQSSLKTGFAVFDKQVDSYLQTMPQFQVDGEFSVDRFQEIISSSLLSVSEFLEIIRTGLLIDQPRLGIMFTSFALPEETNAEAALIDQQRDISYVEVPYKLFLTEELTIPEQKVTEYYAANKKQFMTPERVNVEFVELSTGNIAKSMSPDEQALKSYYQENVSSYTQPTAWKLEGIEVAGITDESKTKASKIADELRIGTAFKDAVAGNKQLELGNEWLTINKVPTGLQKAVINITAAGEVVGPVKTNNGYVIIRSSDIRKPQVQEFEVVKEKVKQSYINQKAEEKFAQMKDQLADLTYAHPDSLKTASDTMGLAIKVSEMFGKETSGEGVSKYKSVRDAAFSSDTLEMQNNSDVIQLQPGTVIVLRVKSHINAKLLPLKEVSLQITNKLKNDEAQKRAADYATKLVDGLNAGRNPQEAVSDKQLKWEELGKVGRYSTKVDSAVLQAAFKLPHPTAKNKVVYGATRVPNGYAIVSVKAIQDGKIDDSQLEVFSEQIQSTQGVMEYALYKDSQIDHAKIKMR